MRPLVRTRRQARQRFQSALNLLNDLWRARTLSGARSQRVIPDDALSGLSLARSGVRQALTAYSTNDRNHNGSTSADAGK